MAPRLGCILIYLVDLEACQMEPQRWHAWPLDFLPYQLCGQQLCKNVLKSQTSKSNTLKRKIYIQVRLSWSAATPCTRFASGASGGMQAATYNLEAGLRGFETRRPVARSGDPFGLYASLRYNLMLRTSTPWQAGLATTVRCAACASPSRSAVGEQSMQLTLWL
jgi:hypothetical protein